jgi:hypothetical protein
MIIKAITVFFKKLFKLQKAQLKTIYLSEVPDNLLDSTIYIVGEKGYYWFAVMLCPCGCKKKIHLNLLQTSSPNWNILRHRDGTISFSPSIVNKTGCRSHFFIRQSKIVWCSKLISRRR